MKSFNGIALGIVIGSLFMSGCTGIDRWWQREHALMPLKEQYWNGELSYHEYREKKEALVASLEATDYMTMTEYKKALREAKDSKTTQRQKVKMDNAEDAEIILKQDDARIEKMEQAPTTSAEVEGDAKAMEAEMAPTNAEINAQMLSNSIKRNSAPSAPQPMVEYTAPEVVVESTAPVVEVEEYVTDSADIRWTKNSDGTVTYQDTEDDELKEQEVK